LVFNAGSSSLKYQLLEMPAGRRLARGRVERLGQRRRRAWAEHRPARGPALSGEVDCAGHARAADLALQRLDAPPEAVGHRVVHGGPELSGPAPADAGLVERLRAIAHLAPLHLPPAADCLERALERLPGLPQAACFDTAFHRSMPDFARLYPVPPEWARDYGLVRYGFHGLSHQYVLGEAARLMGRPLEELRLVSAHLGNGCSLCAWDRGRVLDTSMGLTPLEGVMMGTRGGDLDPAAVTHLMREAGWSAEETVHRLNHDCGLKGVGGAGRDLRGVLEGARGGQARCRLALEMFTHRLRKYLGAYYFALGGAQAVVLTGGIGENSAELRRLWLEPLAGVGLALDAAANQKLPPGRAGEIGGAGPVRLWVVPTDEELMIARQTCRLLAA
jgi:acetate kinase